MEVNNFPSDSTVFEDDHQYVSTKPPLREDSKTNENCKSLEEINEYLSSDPYFFRFYLMRANYYIRASQIDDVSSCEIKFMLNKPSSVVIPEARRVFFRLKNLCGKLDDIGKIEATLILNDLEKTFELDKCSGTFHHKLAKLPDDFTKVLTQTVPTNRMEFLERAYYIAHKFPEKLHECLADFTKVIELSPYDFMTLIERNKYRLSYRDKFDSSNPKLLDELMEECDEVIKKFPNYADGYTSRARLWRRLDNYPRAISDLNVAIGIKTTTMESFDHPVLKASTARSYFNRAICVSKFFGDRSRELEDLNKAIQVNPAYVLALNSRAMLFRKRGLFDLALKDYNVALHHNPNFQMSCYGRGLTYRKLKEFEMAIVDLTRNLSFTEKYYERNSYKYRGMCNLKVERFEAAILDFTKGKDMGSVTCSLMRIKTVSKLKEKIMKM